MDNSPIAKKERIEYIDLAKGFCIIMVVMFHLSSYYDYNFSLAYFMMYFMMPLYFFLSGCFFKTYDSFGSFFKHKVNKLLIPFFFFYFLTSVGVPYVLVYMLGINTSILHIDNIFTAFLTETYPNQPIWFLLCLFEVSIIFYAIFVFDRRFGSKSSLVVCIVSIFLGIIGLTLGVQKIDLPATLDSALSVMPFFAGGYLVFRKTNIMRPNRYDKYLPIIIVLSFTFVLVFHTGYSFFRNLFSLKAAILAYPCAFMGTFGVILLSKLLKDVPLIPYFGRYSLIILVTHIEVFNLFAALLKYSGLNISVGYLYFINIILTMLSYLLIIPFMCKFMPHVIGQKDVIRV